jgi:threonine/homoserine/homoserine lactone efflux protein
MSHDGPLWLFFVLVFGVVALPGLDMAFVLGSALAGGRGRGLAATAGIVAGGACHVVMAALGISVLVRLLPGAFNVLLIAGALYLAWIGWSMLRSEGGAGLHPGASARTGAASFRQGMLTCLLNPKAYLFMLAVFPQFLHPGHGALWLQATAMWAIIAFNQACVYGGVALMADRARRWLQGRPAADAIAVRCVGGLLVAVALLTGFEGWHQL